MKKYMHLVLLLGCMLLSVNIANAQGCPAPFAPQDRLAVKAILFQATAEMTRMNELALYSATNALSSTQRSAMQYEFIALRQDIATLGSQNASRLRIRTVRFLDLLLNIDRLGYANSTVNGTTQEEAIRNSVAASQSVIGALTRMWNCIG